MLSNLPVELFERILEGVDILDILQLKLIDRRAYRIICCSSRIKYRVELLLAGAEDGNYYSLAERQRFLKAYRSNWDNLTPQRTTTIPVPDHNIYELAGGVYGLVPQSSPNSIQLYCLPSVSRRIEMEEWSITDLDFSIDDFAMEPAYGLLTLITYKTGHVKVHLLKLSDGKPHPRARNPLLEYEIPFDPTESGWQIESVIWENKLGCLFTSTSGSDLEDSLTIWDWTTGDLVRVLPRCGNYSFVFLNDDTIIAGRRLEGGGPSLAFFDLSSDENPVIPSPTLAFPDGNAESDVSLRMKLNLGAPVRDGPEFKLRVPFVVNASQQMLFILTFRVGSDDTVESSHSITVPLSQLRNWTRENASFVDWEDWKRSTVAIPTGDPNRATFTMGSRFVIFAFGALVYNLDPHRLMRVGWDPSKPHCQDVPGVWNTVTLDRENGSDRGLIQIFAESTLDIFMTEDNLVVIEMGSENGSKPQLRILSF